MITEERLAEFRRLESDPTNRELLSLLNERDKLLADKARLGWLRDHYMETWQRAYTYVADRPERRTLSFRELIDIVRANKDIASRTSVMVSK